jgi:DNA-binding NtrC family response regulator
MSETVLVIDDDDALRRLLAKVVEGEGLACIEAQDGEAGVLELGTNVIDVLVVDKNLPGMSGLEVAQFVRDEFRDLPIIMITGYSTREAMAEAERLDFTDYLEKPLDLYELRTAIDNARQKRRLGKVVYSVNPEDPTADPPVEIEIDLDSDD